MITFLIFSLITVAIISTITLLVYFPERKYRLVILRWVFGAPIITFILLYTLKPMVGLAALILSVGLCSFIAGPFMHVSFIRYLETEDVGSKHSAFYSLVIAVGFCVFLVLLAALGVFSVV